MPTECERSATSLEAPLTQQQPSSDDQPAAHTDAADKTKTSQQQDNTDTTAAKMDTNGEMSTSQTSNSSSTSNGQNGGCNGAGKKLTPISPDPTSYVTKARVTRPTPPPPSKNPMQFVAIKPCNLYQSAQEQLKKAEEVKKIKEIKKEEPEDWQCNLDNWKSSRRKRVEHIIDRVVEVKKLELEEHDRTRRKSKTFSEMIEERGERGRPRTKLASLAVYNEDESNDLSDLGIGTSSASGKSSQSEDYDNNSVMSDNAELDKPSVYEGKPNTTNHHANATTATNGSTREYISSPGYDTSSSTAPASSPDPCEYTYEGAIQDYKQRVSRASVSGTTTAAAPSGPAHNGSPYKMSNGSKETTPDRASAPPNDGYPTRRGSKIEDRLIGFEVTSPSDNQEGAEKNKVAVDVPKIDISKRKEIFESQSSVEAKPKPKPSASAAVPKVTLRDRFQFAASGDDKEKEAAKKETKRLSGDITSIRERLQSLEQQQNIVNAAKTHAASSNNSSAADMPPVAPLKDRLSSLQASVTKEVERKPPVSLIDARQLEIMKTEEEQAKQRMRQMASVKPSVVVERPPEKAPMTQQDLKECHKDDSGIHMESGDEPAKPSMAQQEEQLNAAIAALALEERQLEAAANAVNQIEAEFAELSATNSVMMPPLAHEAAASDPMEFSINEALELALEAIDKETSKITATPTTIRKTQMTSTTKTKSMTSTTTTAMTTIQTTTMMSAIENEDTADGGLREAITNNSSSSNGAGQQLIQNQQQQLRVADDAENNRTDEEKELKTKLQQQQQQLATLAGNRNDDDDPLVTPSPPPNDDDDDELQIEADDEADEEEAEDRHELKIAKEPIYENIAATTTSMYELDVAAVTKIIPMTNNNMSSNNQMNANNMQIGSNNYKNDNLNNNNNQMNNNITNNNNQNNINHIQNNNTQNKVNNNTQNKHNNSNQNNSNNNNNKDIFDDPLEAEPSQNHRPLVELPPKERPITAAELPTPADPEPYYQVPKPSEPYYDAPRHLRPVPLYENIEVFYTGLEGGTAMSPGPLPEPPKEKPPPPPVDSPPLFDEGDADDNVDGPLHNNNNNMNSNTNTWSSDNTYETISSRHSHEQGQGGRVNSPPPPIKRMNSTKRIKKELRSKRSSFLGIEGTAPDDEDSYLEYIVAPPPDMAQLLQEERRLEKQLYMKAGLCDSSDTGDSRDSGVSENHSRQSSEPYTNSSEEMDRHSLKSSPMAGSPDAYHHAADMQIGTAPTPLLQTVKGNSAESWTESATAAAAASQSLTEATATANAKMMSIEEKIREQEEVLRVERELLQLEQEELKRQRENLMLRENMARRELQHGAKMLMSANRRSLQDLNASAGLMMAPTIQATAAARPQALAGHQQQIYANVPPPVPQHPHYYQVQADYRKSLSDLNEFSKRLMLAPPTPPTKPMRAANGVSADDYRRQPLMGGAAPFGGAGGGVGGSLVKIATQPMATPRGPIYSNYQQQQHHQSVQNLSTNAAMQPGNMSRNTLHALSATPKPKYTDGWVQVQSRKSYEAAAATNLANDPAWMSAYQQKRKSMPDAALLYQQQQQQQQQTQGAYHHNNSNNKTNSNNHWLVQEAEQRRLVEQQRKSASSGNTPTHRAAQSGNGKPLPDSIIQTLTERVQSKGIGERKRFDKTSPLHSNNYHHHHHQTQQHQHQHPISPKASQQQPTAAHRHFVGNGLEAVTDSNGLSVPQAAGQAANSSVPPATSPDKVLSVSGKKKCSHCGDELGRGAAMIIESLLLFYHINCFKCCVCHVQLGDGLNGTDVRVRNHKLHCQNCYSSDDGIKFSCV